jgi:hypothetical protein
MSLDALISDRLKQLRSEEAARTKAEQEALVQAQKQFEDQIKFLTDLAVSIGIKKADLTASNPDAGAISFVSAVVQGISVGLEYHASAVKLVVPDGDANFAFEVPPGVPPLKDRVLEFLIDSIAKIRFAEGKEVELSTSKPS